MTLAKLTEELHTLSKEPNSDQLILSNAIEAWDFHVFRGKLLYTTDRLHRVRRWHRALARHCPKWNWSADYAQLSDDPLWECRLLDQGVKQNQLSMIQAKLVIRTVFQECSFELSSQSTFRSDWQPTSQVMSAFCSLVALSSVETQVILAQTVRMQEKWHALGCSHLYPTQSPTISEGVDPQALSTPEMPGLGSHLEPNRTLWDLAQRFDRSIADVAAALLPLAEQGMVQFHKVDDLADVAAAAPIPPDQPPAIAAPAPERGWVDPQKQPLIACIDDSPVLAHTLKKILVSAGYRMLSIAEPMRGFSQLIENKPDLILLDLLLPNADGYSICKFLRDTPVFKKTPIIILTGKSGSFDRARAQLVGATEFLSKPPQPEELLQLLQKHLR